MCQILYLWCPNWHLYAVAPNKEPVQGLALHVAEVVSGERSAQRLTLQQLADRSGIPYRTLIRYIPDRKEPEREMSLGTIVIVGEALGLTLEQILAAAREREIRVAGGTGPVESGGGATEGDLDVG